MFPRTKTERLLPRKILGEVAKYFDDEHILLIVGSRQTGKTSLLYLIIEDLLHKGISQDQIYYLSLEDFSILETLNQNAHEFANYLKGLGADLEKRNYVFIDEIQYLNDPTHFLKYVFDQIPGLKLFVTGSSSLAIRQKFKDSLAGRKVVFELPPLSFSECLQFKGEDKLAELVERHSLRPILARGHVEDFPLRPFQDKLLRYYSEFILYGGYPRIVREPVLEKKMTFLDELVQAYIRKDIKDLMRIDNIHAFNNLLKVLALQIGNMMNYAQLANSLQMSRETLERYLFLLENTFIIKRITPFFSNRRKEVVKMTKLYFLDTGMRNAILKNFQELSSRADAGALVENAVFNNLQKSSSLLEEIHFWRTQSKNEVDFVLYENEPTPIEVKFSHYAAPALPSGLRSFCNDYPGRLAVVLTQNAVSLEKFGEINALFLPVWAA